MNHYILLHEKNIPEDYLSFYPNDIENYKKQFESYKSLFINCEGEYDFEEYKEIIKQNIYELPENINHLKITNIWWGRFNFNIDNLTTLTIEGHDTGLSEQYFMDKIKYFPRNLKYLEIGKFYNHPLDNLPNGLEILNINNHYNQPLVNLPDTLKYLFFGSPSEFNHSLDYLPDSVKYIEFDRYSNFNQPINNLPPDLEILKFCGDSEFKQSLINLPKKLKKLFLSSWNYIDVNTVFPDSVEELEVYYVINEETNLDCVKLPMNLKKCKTDSYMKKDDKNYFINKYPNVIFTFG